MTDLNLRAACIHGRYEPHGGKWIDESVGDACSGGREVTDDMEKMWVCLFDGPNDLCEQGKMTSKHQELCGEFWLLPLAAAIGDTE